MQEIYTPPPSNHRQDQSSRKSRLDNWSPIELRRSCLPVVERDTDSMALHVKSLEIAHHLNKKNKFRISCSLDIIALLALLRKKRFKTQVFERSNSGFLQDIESYNQNPGQRRFLTTGPRNDIPLLALGTVKVSHHSHIADYQSENLLKQETPLISSQGLLGRNQSP